MRRVVVSGMGIISCLGNDLEQVAQALYEGRSGLAWQPEYAQRGMRSCVAGVPDISGEQPLPRKIRRFMGDASLYAYLAARHALIDAGLEVDDIANPLTGLIVGSGVGSPYEHHLAVAAMSAGGISKIAPYAVPRIMGSTTSACLATALGIQGISYSISSACATAAHCIGQGADLIRHGRQERVIVGAAEEVRWTTSAMFDAMGALSSAYNDTTASRPFDEGRDGFVIAGGAGILVLEALEVAQERGAPIRAEVVGYGACSDGVDMVTPDSGGAARAMRLALNEAGGSVDYINAHATSTPLGDVSELAAIREIFGDRVPLISSTKGLSGHPIAASAAHEAIYSLLMMERGFVAGCANITRLDAACAGFPLVPRTLTQPLNSVMSNSFGFGGTNACLIFRRFQ